jgi:hypothetical protein
MTRDLRNVDAAQPGHAGLRIGGPGSGQEGESSQRLFELVNEDVRMGSVLQPPLLLTLNMATGRGRESPVAASM